MSRTLEYAQRQAREGRAIRRARDEAGLSLMQVAVAAGTGPSTVAGVEKGGGSDAMRQRIRGAIKALRETAASPQHETEHARER